MLGDSGWRFIIVSNNQPCRVINSYSQSDVDENSLSLGVFVPVTRKVSFGKNDHRVIVNGQVFENDETSIAPYLKFGSDVKLIPTFVFTTHAEPIDRYSIRLHLLNNKSY